MRFCPTVSALFLLAIPSFSQGLGLQQYVKRLQTTSGITVEDRVRLLRELERFAQSPSSLSQNYLTSLRRAQSYTVIPLPLGWSRIQHDWNPNDSYTVIPLPLGWSRIQHDWNPKNSYTAYPLPLGGYRIQNDWNPKNSYTAYPLPLGGYRIQNDWSLMGSYTMTPRPLGGFRMQR